MNFVKKLGFLVVLAGLFVSPFIVAADVDAQVIQKESQDVWVEKLNKLVLASPGRVVFIKSWPSSSVLKNSIRIFFDLFAKEVLVVRPSINDFICELAPVGAKFTEALFVGFGLGSVNVLASSTFQDKEVFNNVTSRIITPEMLQDSLVASKDAADLMVELLLIIGKYAPEAHATSKMLLETLYRGAFALVNNENFDLVAEEINNVLSEFAPKLFDELGFSGEDLTAIAGSLVTSSDFFNLVLNPKISSKSSRSSYLNQDGMWVPSQPEIKKIFFRSSSGSMSSKPNETYLAVYDVASSVLCTDLPVAFDDTLNMTDALAGSFLQSEDLGVAPLSLVVGSSVAVKPLVKDHSDEVLDKNNFIIIPQGVKNFIVSWA